MNKKPLHTATTTTTVAIESTGSVLPICKAIRIPEYDGEWIMEKKQKKKNLHTHRLLTN